MPVVTTVAIRMSVFAIAEENRLMLTRLLHLGHRKSEKRTPRTGTVFSVQFGQGLCKKGFLLCPAA